MSIKQCVVLGSVIAAASAAQAQWTYTVLAEGTQAAYPSVNAVWGNRQAGAMDNGLQSPVIWDGTAGSMTYLPTPLDADGIQVTGMSATGMVGEGYVRLTPETGYYGVFLWNAEGTTVTTIAPPEGFNAYGYGIGGDQQVGAIENQELGGAVPTLWRGTSASRVNLRPAGYTGGRANGTDGTQQVGYVVTESWDSEAALWTGTAASFVSLHPSGWMGSEAYGVSGGRQCGYVYGEVDARAAVWSGTAESMVDLHPVQVPGLLSSYAEGISGNVVCGEVYLETLDGNQDHAAVWMGGTAESFVDLHSLLGPDFYGSRANAVWTNGSVIHVVGEGESMITGYSFAILWTLEIGPTCRVDFNQDGFLDFFDYDAFVVCYETEVCEGGNADFNGDGFVDFFDYDDFVVAYEQGC